jgi:SAM-dependent methyltransferase
MPVVDNSVDVIISNCVVNLAPEKQKVYAEAFRVLKSGGRMLVSDIVTEGKLLQHDREDLDSWAACIAGALPEEEYLSIIKGAGFRDVRIVSEAQFGMVKGIRVKSISVEAYKPSPHTSRMASA